MGSQDHDDNLRQDEEITAKSVISSPQVQDAIGRAVDDREITKEVERGFWTPYEVPPSISGISRPMTVMLAKRGADLIKFAYHGDKETFCPPLWADIAIGSGACGYACRACFLMLTFRTRRDPFRPVVYANGDDYERAVWKWLHAEQWKLKRGDGKYVWRQRSNKDAIGLGIDCADSLLWEGVTGHARRLIPLFTSSNTNRLANPLILLTKSANTHFLDEICADALNRGPDGHVPNVVVTMSLNPEAIADLWEGKFPDTMERVTPPITRRLAALRHAQDMGFEVRVRVDPILTPPGWEAHYEAFFAELAHAHGLRPTMFTLGTYREKLRQLDAFRAKWGLPEMEWKPVTTNGREGTHVHDADRENTYRRVHAMIERAYHGTGFAPHISLCKETHEVRKAVRLCNANCNCLQSQPRNPRSLPVLR